MLKHPWLTFGGREVDCIADAFSTLIQSCKYTCYACAIMPDHVHLVIRKHRDLAEEIIRRFQRAGFLALIDRGLVPFDHPVWGGPGWKVFLDEPDDVWRTIPYVDDNPVKAHLPRQSWPFVTPYNNWPLHDGHSPNSPYARRLRGR